MKVFLLDKNMRTKTKVPQTLTIGRWHSFQDQLTDLLEALESKQSVQAQTAQMKLTPKLALLPCIG